MSYSFNVPSVAPDATKASICLSNPLETRNTKSRFNVRCVLNIFSAMVSPKMRNYTEDGLKSRIWQGGCANFLSGASDHCTSTRRERRQKICCKANVAKFNFSSRLQYISGDSGKRRVDPSAAIILRPFQIPALSS